MDQILPDILTTQSFPWFRWGYNAYGFSGKEHPTTDLCICLSSKDQQELLTKILTGYSLDRHIPLTILVDYYKVIPQGLVDYYKVIPQEAVGKYIIGSDHLWCYQPDAWEVLKQTTNYIRQMPLRLKQHLAASQTFRYRIFEAIAYHIYCKKKGA